MSHHHPFPTRGGSYRWDSETRQLTPEEPPPESAAKDQAHKPVPFRRRKAADATTDTTED